MKDQLLQAMKAAATAGGALLMDRKGRDLGVENKSSARDVVTKYDLAVQNTIVRQLHGEFPQAGFINEEGAADGQLAGEITFVIDPIDGTMNFVKDFHHSCISIACLAQGQPVAAVVFDPYADEMFSAALGKGAWLNSRPIRVSNAPLAENLVLFGTSPYCPEASEQTFEAVKQIYPKCLDVRRFGSAALDICYVACGRAGLFFEAQLSLWDFAAGALILTEAGGTLCDLCGNAVSFSVGKSSVVAGPARIIGECGLIEEVAL